MYVPLWRLQTMEQIFDFLREDFVQTDLSDTQYDHFGDGRLLVISDMKFVKTSDEDVDLKALKKLIIDHVNQGVFAHANPLDGYAHDYIELGAWIGDQRAAITLMACMTLSGLTNITMPILESAEETEKAIRLGEIVINAKREHISYVHAQAPDFGPAP